jgi:hypothetical protein
VRPRPTPSGAATNSSSRQEQKIAPPLMIHFGSSLAGDVWLDEFTSWLLRTTWNIENTGDASAREPTNAVEFALAENSSGLLTFYELRIELRVLSRQLHLNVASM